MDHPELTDSTVGALIEAFIRRVSAVAPDDPGFQHDADLFDTGYLDSLGLVALTAFLEETFALHIGEEMLFDPAFTSIAGIAHLITQQATPR